MKLVIKVVEIHGSCPVYKLGDKIVLDEGYKVNLKETDGICMHSLTSILPYYNLLTAGVDMGQFGLLKKGDSSSAPRVRCLDPVEYTGGGSVVFEMTRVED